MGIENLKNLEIIETEYIYNFNTNKVEKVNGILLIKNNRSFFLDKTKQTWKELKTSKEEKDFIKKMQLEFLHIS